VRWEWIEPNPPAVSLAVQCQLLGLSRSTWYERASAPSALNVELMRRLDEEYTAHPFYGSRRMTAVLRRAGYAVNRKRVLRLMRQMGLAAIYPKPALSRPDPDHRLYPYLLRGVTITSPDHVWSTDINVSYVFKNNKLFLCYDRQHPICRCVQIERRFFILIGVGDEATQQIQHKPGKATMTSVLYL